MTTEEERTAFFRAVLGNGLPDDLWAHLWHLSDKHTDWVRDTTAAEQSAGRNGRQDVYFGTGLVKQPGSHDERVREETAAGLLGVLADIDIAHPIHKETALPPDESAALALLDELGLPPTLVIHSGHGVQGWWLFQRPWQFDSKADKQRAVNLCAAWQAHIKSVAAEHGWEVDNVGDLPRILRVPGTLNAKEPDQSVAVRLISVAAAARYTPDQLRAACEFPGAIEDSDGGLGDEPGARPRPFTREHPCPACTGYRELPQGTRRRCYGYESSYVDVFFCTREEHAGKLKGQPVMVLGRPHWMHTLHGECECGTTHGRPEDAPPHAHVPLSSVERRAYALGYTLNDQGNAKRFVDRFGRDFRYVMDLKVWIGWDGVRWAVAETGQVEQAIRDTIAPIIKEAWRIPDDATHEKARKAWIGWAGQSGMGNHLDKTLKIAQTMRGIPVLQRQLDANKALIGFPNGYYNLETDEFTPRERFGGNERRALITKLLGAPYDPDAQSALWDTTFARFVPKPEERQDLETAWGYGLSGRPKEHIFLGAGNTKRGKSTLLNAVANAYGDYAVTVGMDTFLSSTYNRPGGAREDLVALVGRRMILASESNENARLNAAQLKHMTGADTMSLRANYGKQFNAMPSFTIWMLTNHEPKLAADDDAIWERVHVFKFDQYIKPEERDETVRDRVTDPAVTGSAILAACLRGWRRYRDEQHGRLSLPTTVAETKAYRSAQDVVAQFIDECCTEYSHDRVPCSVFKRAFRYYLFREGIKEQYTDTRIGQAMTDRHYQKEKSGDWTYLGVAVRTEWLGELEKRGTWRV